ncbi:MAG: SMC-Scp complex subunit ScpB [Phycisphaerales bacterium]|nr:SMC-Scp complex subunit ScpB [Phycisphaerales bacterium]
MTQDATAASTNATQLSVQQRVEALLVTADRAVSTSRLAVAADATSAEVDAAIEQLNAAWADSGHVLQVQRVAGGWRVQTIADVAPVLAEAAARRGQHKLSQAALETLSVIAYRQPVMRAEIEAIRGVACGEVLRGLMERRLIRIAGRAEEVGRPMLYGTSREFLQVFALGSIDDLPEVEGLERRPRVSVTEVAPEEGSASPGNSKDEAAAASDDPSEATATDSEA